MMPGNPKTVAEIPLAWKQQDGCGDHATRYECAVANINCEVDDEA